MGSAGAPPRCGRGVTDPLKYAHPHMCYPVVFGRSTPNGKSIIKEIRLKT